MAQLTARETIEHHIGLLRGYLEAIPTATAHEGGTYVLIDEYSVFVDEFWEAFDEVAPRQAPKFYYTFTRASGEEGLRTLAHYPQDMWPEMAKCLSEKMAAQSADVLYLLTEEAAMPEEYLELLNLPV